MDLDFNRVCDGSAIGSFEHHHDHDQRLLAVLAAHAGQHRRAKCHLRDIAYEDRDAVLAFDDDPLHVALAASQTHAADHLALARPVHHAAARVAVVLLKGFHHFVHPDTAGPQGLRIDDDLELLHAPIGGADIGDSGNRAQLRADEPVLQSAQLHRAAHLALHRVHVDVPKAGGDRAKLGSLHIRRKLRFDVDQPLVH